MAVIAATMIGVTADHDMLTSAGTPDGRKTTTAAMHIQAVTRSDEYVRSGRLDQTAESAMDSAEPRISNPPSQETLTCCPSPTMTRATPPNEPTNTTLLRSPRGSCAQ